MAIANRIDLTGCLTVEDCEQILFSDETGSLVSACVDDQNDLGYGLIGGIALNDVTGAILNIYYPGLTTPFKFTFTIVNAVITVATLTDLNGTVTNITANLESTVFPLTEFDITLAAYGVTLPELTDGIIKWDYTISGTSGVDDFGYVTSGGILNTCDVECCIENKYLELDPTCQCSENKKQIIKEAEFWLAAAKYAINVGQDSKADALLTKAKDVCNSNCDC